LHSANTVCNTGLVNGFCDPLPYLIRIENFPVNIYGEVFYSDEVGQRIAEAINQAGVANGVGGVQMLTSSVT
tara:strand:- start:201 stop:416 length:216 start_codon:yes stop_codon:yes gene_type:complete